MATFASRQRFVSERWRELGSFVAVGVASNAVYFAFLCVLDWSRCPVWLSAAIAYAVSMSLNYTLQRSLTFRSKTAHRTAGPRYLLVMGGALVLNSVAMQLLTSRVGLSILYAQILTLFVTTALSWLGQKLWAFSSKRAMQ